MQVKHLLFLTLGLATAGLSSCSRANYAFNNSAPAYLGSEQVHAPAKAEVVAPETAVATTASEVAPAAVEVAPAHQAATALAHRSAPAAARPATTTAEAPAPATAAPQAKLTHADRKALRQELKRQLRAPENKLDSGKSQLVALLLLIFLGGIGVHRFYLGYVGRGFLYIALLLTSFLIVPAIALLVLLILDLIGLITGSLKPKNGEYAKTL